MSTYSADSGTSNRPGHDRLQVPGHRRDTVETKPAFKTTELMVWALTVAAVLIAASVTENLDGHDAWKFVSWLSIGYMVSRGLAKAGSYQKDDDPRSGSGDSHRH